MKARRTAALGALLMLGLVCLTAPSAQASFGIESFSLTAENEDSSVDFQAGDRPYELDFHVEMNTHEQGGIELSDATLRALTVDLPPGLIGDPLAVPRCTRAQFAGILPHCPGDTQIGFAHVALGGLGTAESPVYNLVPPLGVPATFGFSIDNNSSLQEASLRSSTDFGASVSDLTVPTGISILSIDERIWGVPADPSHDPQRWCRDPGPEGAVIEGCESDSPLRPFLALPASCGEPLATTLSVESLQEPGVLQSKTAYSEEGGTKAGLDGCNALEFKPTISSQPSTNRADSPSGLEFDLHQPQNNACNPGPPVGCGLATAQLRDTTVTLPQGMTLNPSAANGLGACTESQIGLIGTGFAPPNRIHFSKDPQGCPDASKVGTLEVKSPKLLDHTLNGAVYVAKPFENPFGSLLAIYLAVEDEQTGTIAKLAGKVEPDPVTGQLKTTFVESPQLPLEDVALHIFNGARAALKTPISCGAHTTTSTLTPWSTPEGADAHPADTFQITQPASSGPCPSSEAAAPNSPSFTAGTVSPQAAAYSPFVLKLSRPDGSQQLTGIDTTLPEGLLGRLVGTSICPEAAIAQAKAREKPNMGAVEQASPSCPASSQVGTVTVGAGAGPTPFYATGKAYLAGPYKSAPLSLAIVTPAVAGPFDLGAVVVRAALYVNPETTRITAASDPIPQVIDGIPLDVRSIAVSVDRPNFTFNPTSCDPMSIVGSASTAPGQSAALSSPFQVGGCSALGFKPSLSLRLKGGTKRASNPKLIATLTPRAGDADISSLAVKLPPSAFLDQSHIRTICTRVQFAADQCPPGSIYGRVSVQTPILPYALSGNVYLRSSSNKLPDLIADLRGPAYQPIRFDLSGRTDSVKGALRNTFDFVPDAPFTKATLELNGGKRGLIVNSRDLCRHAYRAEVSFTAHNGKTYEAGPKVQNSCKGQKRKSHAKKKGGRR